MSLLYNKLKQNVYLYSQENLISELQPNKDITLPINVDTEFYEPDSKYYLNPVLPDTMPLVINGKHYNFPIHKEYGKRQPLTTQISSIDGNHKIILDSPIFAANALSVGLSPRHHIANSGFHPVDFLRLATGWNFSLINIGKNKTQFDKNSEYKKLPIFEFKIYSHFYLAEHLMIADNVEKNGHIMPFRDDLLKLCQSNKYNMADMKKRFKLVSKKRDGTIRDGVIMPWLLTIKSNGEIFKYWVKITIIDSCALHGVASLENLADVCHITMPYKGLMDEYKHIMIIGYFEKPNDYDLYSLGDLEIYNILKNNAENFKEVYRKLNIEQYYQEPKLTIGATVRDIFVSLILKYFGVESWDTKLKEHPKLFKICTKGIDNLAKDAKEKYLKTMNRKRVVDVILEVFFKNANAGYLKFLTDDNRCLNSKVFGGRCRNNRPTDTLLESLIIDIDGAGMYGQGQANQLLPIGTPVIEGQGFKLNGINNNYQTLRQWLKKLKYSTDKSELVSGAWQAVVSCKKLVDGSYEQLKYPQDFIASWFDFKIENKEIIDNEDEMNVKTGTSKIFHHQIINGVINHDFLEWLDNVCSTQQRNELLDNLYIQTAIYYPKSQRVETLEQLIEETIKHNGKNYSFSAKSKTKYRTINIDESSTKWLGVNLGELLIWDLLALRGFEPEKINVNGKETKNPFNTLYKLIINTLYGIAVSPFFNSSNVVVGNNITARARAFIWYTEKGLNLGQSITDGGCFELLKVLYPKTNRRLIAHKLTDIYRLSPKELNNEQMRLAPLGNAKTIDLNWEELEGVYKPCLTVDGIEYKGKKAEQWINETAIKHLRQVFPYPEISVLFAPSKKLKIDVENKTYELVDRIGQFEFKMKDFYDSGVFHGSANYLLINPKSDNIAFRSYEKGKQHSEFNIDDCIELNDYNNSKETPAKFFLNSLKEDSQRVERQKPFIKTGILKVNDFRNRQGKYLEMGINPGDSIIKSGLLREFSPSQFTYKSLEQYKNIIREYQSNKNKYSQSWEGFFQDDNGYLNYQKMLEEIDIAINNNVISLNNYFDEHRNKTRDNKALHLWHDKLVKIRDIINNKESLNFKIVEILGIESIDQSYESLIEESIYLDDDFILD